MNEQVEPQSASSLLNSLGFKSIQDIKDDPTKVLNLVDNTPNSHLSIIVPCEREIDARLTPHPNNCYLFILDFVQRGSQDRYKQSTNMTVTHVGSRGELDPVRVNMLKDMVPTKNEDELYVLSLGKSYEILNSDGTIARDRFLFLAESRLPTDRLTFRPRFMDEFHQGKTFAEMYPSKS